MRASRVKRTRPKQGTSDAQLDAKSLEDPLQRYQIMEPLGSGGQGTTFRAIDRQSGDSVAVKVLSLKGAKGWKGFDLFEREIATLSRLEHPAIPKYLDNFAYEQSGDYFLVMELVEGAPLSRFIGGTKLPLPRLRRVFAQLLDVLEHLHRQAPPIVHRDVKPSNILLRSDDSIALVDFGGVRTSASTHASTMVGTFGFMAPEQLIGDAGPSSDLYALGATTLALLTGHTPEELPRRGLRVDFAALDLPEPFDRVLPRLVEPDPDDRVGTVAQVRSLLTRPKPTPTASRPPSSNLPKRTSPAPQSTALATMPAEAIALAKTPAPLSFVIWIFAALGSGALLLFEAAFLPLFFQLVTAIQQRSPDHPKQVEFKADYERFKASVANGRRIVSHVADGTRPGT